LPGSRLSALVINGLIALMLVEAARPIACRTVAGYDARAGADVLSARAWLSSRIVGDTAKPGEARRRRALPRELFVGKKYEVCRGGGPLDGIRVVDLTTLS
jgi:hypothetical protein